MSFYVISGGFFFLMKTIKSCVEITLPIRFWWLTSIFFFSFPWLHLETNLLHSEQSESDHLSRSGLRNNSFIKISISLLALSRYYSFHISCFIPACVFLIFISVFTESCLEIWSWSLGFSESCYQMLSALSYSFYICFWSECLVHSPGCTSHTVFSVGMTQGVILKTSCHSLSYSVNILMLEERA